MVKIIRGDVNIISLLEQDIPSPQDFYKNYIKERKPIIFQHFISSMGDDWKKVKQEWQLNLNNNNLDELVQEMKLREDDMLNYWKNRFNNLEVFINQLHENGLSHPPNFEKKMNFNQAIEDIKIQERTKKSVNGKWIYCQQIPVKDLPSLKDDYKIPNLFKSSPYSILGANTFFLGTTNTRTTLHYDRPLVDNLFLQIWGEKRWILYEPQEGEYFYPFGFETKYAHVSQIPELEGEVDLQKFPLFEKSNVLCEFILQPGDLVYLPKGYWHYVKHETLSVSLNFWYY
ncbi:hypothetical protein ABK040_000399 [Willaertia magna]